MLVPLFSATRATIALSNDFVAPSSGTPQVLLASYPWVFSNAWIGPISIRSIAGGGKLGGNAVTHHNCLPLQYWTRSRRACFGA
jgi:hypothetical protein